MADCLAIVPSLSLSRKDLRGIANIGLRLLRLTSVVSRVKMASRIYRWERPALFVVAIIFLTILFVTAILIPNPSHAQEQIFRTILSLAAGGFGAFLPGAFNLKFVKPTITVRATSAAAFFVFVYSVDPGMALVQRTGDRSPIIKATGNVSVTYQQGLTPEQVKMLVTETVKETDKKSAQVGKLSSELEKAKEDGRWRQVELDITKAKLRQSQHELENLRIKLRETAQSGFATVEIESALNVAATVTEKANHALEPPRNARIQITTQDDRTQLEAVIEKIRQERALRAQASHEPEGTKP
jgi:hypothetical protein